MYIYIYIYIHIYTYDCINGVFASIARPFGTGAGAVSMSDGFPKSISWNALNVLCVPLPAAPRHLGRHFILSGAPADRGP